MNKDAFCVCRVLSDQELEQSVAGYANHGAATFSKGKATSRYTFIPKSDSPGPIYDIRTAPGVAHHQPCALLLLPCMWLCIRDKMHIQVCGICEGKCRHLLSSVT